jgi:hypothetical protein
MKIDTDNETIICEEVEQGGYVQEIEFTDYQDKTMWK